MASFAFTRMRGVQSGHGRSPQKPNDNNGEIDHQAANPMCLRCGEERTAQHALWRKCTQQCMHCETFEHVGTGCPEVSEAFYKPSPGFSKPYNTQFNLGKRFWDTQAELHQTNLDNQKMAEEIHDLKQKVKKLHDTVMENQTLRTRMDELTRELGHVRRERDDARCLSHEASNLHVDALQEQFILQARITKTIALLTGKENTSQNETVSYLNDGHDLQAEYANTTSTEYLRPDKSRVCLLGPSLRLSTPPRHDKPRVRLPGMPLCPSTPPSPVAMVPYPDFDHSLQTGAHAFDSFARRNTLAYEYVYNRTPNTSHTSRTTSHAHTTLGTKREMSEDGGYHQIFKKVRSTT